MDNTTSTMQPIKLELGKKYDIVYCTKYEPNYLNKARVGKITKLMYLLDLDDGSTWKIRKDSVIEARECHI